MTIKEALRKYPFLQEMGITEDVEVKEIPLTEEFLSRVPVYEERETGTDVGTIEEWLFIFWKTGDLEEVLLVPSYLYIYPVASAGYDGDIPEDVFLPGLPLRNSLAIYNLDRAEYLIFRSLGKFEGMMENWDKVEIVDLSKR